ncbi:MAG: hypothetical protein MRY64_01770 [Hyphomonadaceae bacterium]|nr:hypothetical protein [Hyphomonadaceae bacterium]
MKRVFVLAAATLMLTACSMREKPLMQIQDMPISVEGGEAGVSTAIKSTLRGRGWQVVDEEPGAITAQFIKPNADVGQHSVTINISYDADSYSFDYVDSENMLYDASDKTIHRNYNRWIANLQSDLARAE